MQENQSSQETIAKAGPTSDLIALLKDGTAQAKEYALPCTTRGTSLLTAP